METVRLNLGCGSVTPAGWQNVDYALGARLARLPVVGRLANGLGLIKLRWDPSIVIHDLSRPFPWAPESVDAIYSSHTLEHFDRADGLRFLLECFRVLKPSGVIRIVVPDLATHVNRYLSGVVRADGFLEDLDVLTGMGMVGLKRTLAPLVQYPHKCMYDQEALQRVVASCGFECRARKPFDSEIPDISALELESRTEGAAIVEGTRPARLIAVERSH